MNNTTEIIEGLNIGTKEQYRAAMVETLINGDRDTIDKGLFSLRTFIFRSFADLIQQPSYDGFKLTAISAWENDETHIRHLSCNDFNGHALQKNVYKHNKKTMTHGYPWKPGLRLGDVRRDEKGVLNHNWDGDCSVEDVLEWLIDGMLTYYFGRPSNGLPGIDSPEKEQQRHKILCLLGADYNCANFLYDAFEASGCTGFGNEGAVGEIRLNLDGSEYTSHYFGQAYVPEPQLVIESESHNHLSENVYI